MNKQRMLTDRRFYTACPKCSTPPGKFRFNVHPIEEVDELLIDGTEVSCVFHSYSVRDGVLLALSKSPFEGDNMIWAFTATSERQGLVDLKIGIVEEIVFDEPFEEVYYVTKSHIPPRIASENYGRYAFQLVVDVLRPSGFKFVSSYFHTIPPADEAGSFLIGWNAYGRMEGDKTPPIWRTILANAYKHLLMGRWYLALLESAFAMESFFDALLSSKLRHNRVPDRYINHILRVGERPEEIRAIRDMRGYPSVSNNQVEKLTSKLNSDVFSPRNNLAHGKSGHRDITEDVALKAAKTVQETIWDWDRDSRKWLLLIERESSIYELRDEELPMR